MIFSLFSLKIINTTTQVEVWKAAGMESIGDKVQFLYASDEINKNPG